VRLPHANASSVPFGLARKRRWLPAAAGVAVLALVVTPAIAVFAPRVPLVAEDSGLPGRHADGSVQLINQRTITPAGQQSDLGDLPLNALLSPDGKRLLVANGGAGIQSLQVVDTNNGKVLQEIPYTVPDSVFVGLTYSPDGQHVYASGGGSNVIHTFAVAADGLLTATGDWKRATQKTPLGDAPWPIGLSVSPDGKTLYVADNLANDVALIDTTNGALIATVPVGSFPYTPLVSRDGKRVFVSNWGDATISTIDVANRSVVATIKVGDHPSAMILGADDLLFVADANSDAISVVHTDRNQETSRVSLAPYSKAPLSSSPVGLALSPDGKTLYAADAGADEVSVIALKASGEPGDVVGRLPTAWYPTSVNVSKDGRTVWVTNGKGLGAGPNGGGADPNPTRRNPPVVDGLTGYNDGYCNCSFDKYTGSMIVGTLSAIGVPGPERLRLYSQQVARNNHYPQSAGGDDDKSDRVAQSDDGEDGGHGPIPAAGGTSPIKHVIYVIKENRTFDQVFGDESAGNTDPSLTLFPRANTPNLHSLVERFGILDNFYADAEVSADGHNWATSANATDYNEKMWPQDYSPGVGRNRGYDFEGGTRINLSPGGYLWDAAAQAGITFRDYGEFVNNGGNLRHIPESQADTCPGPPVAAAVKTRRWSWTTTTATP
jgi:YVTN family beta-propeller protein